MKLIIDIEKDYYEMLKYNVEHGQEYKPFEIIANGIPYEERPQGEWARHDEWVGGEYVGGFYHVNCPCIDLETAYYSKWRTHFCPNCGAKMKGGAE